MEIKVYSLSHVGKVRSKNQDNFYCNGITPGSENDNFADGGSLSMDKPLLFGVFDGMGGHLHGERASLFAVEASEKLFRQYRGNDPYGVMNEICRVSNERICEEMENVVKGRMGSTASMLLFEQESMFICNLGDSPIFLIRNGAMKQISYEHTERHNYEQIFGNDYNKKKKFRLTQHLGIFPTEMELAPYNNQEDILPGDRFLICSDGLTDMVENEEITSIVSGVRSVEKAAQVLLNRALENGGKDNITIILGEISGKPTRQVPFTVPVPRVEAAQPVQPVQTVQAADSPVQPQQQMPHVQQAQQVSHNNTGTGGATEEKDVKRKVLMAVAIALAVIAVAITGVIVFMLMQKPQDPQPAPETTAAAQAATLSAEKKEKAENVKKSAGEAMNDMIGVFNEQNAQNKKEQIDQNKQNQQKQKNANRQPTTAAASAPVDDNPENAGNGENNADYSNGSGDNNAENYGE